MTRKLVLKKDTLSELTAGELGSVVGAEGTHITCYTRLTYCPCTGLIGPLPSINSPCQTR